MYKKESEGLLKHWDFALLDMLCLQLAFWLSYALSGYGWDPYGLVLYRNMAAFVELVDFTAFFALHTMKNVLKRDFFREFAVTLQHAAVVGAIAVFYLFALQRGQLYSRLALVLMIVIYALLTFTVRQIWKSILRRRAVDRKSRSLLLITTSDLAESAVQDIKKQNYAGYFLNGIAFLDRPLMAGEQLEIGGVRVVADALTAPRYVCRGWVDEVLVIPSDQDAYPERLIQQLEETGVTVHTNLARVNSVPGRRQLIEHIGNYTVLTTSINYAPAYQFMLKRVMDIVVGLIGCIVTCVLFIFVAPAIFFASPGPIFFSQERVGQNGKTFRMYKFRSMYMDAEDRLADLMKDNKMSDSKMFKMDFDPRVIGNRVLEDGTRRTGIGHLLRRTSIDEFPQFFNVLRGDMSIVGTRPPLPSETRVYDLHHRVRLAIKPGITGLWQVSGRSDITDFEEVVRLDKEYISNWNLALDIKILMKTVLVVFKKGGAV